MACSNNENPQCFEERKKMSSFNKKLRGTGRTYRMLEYAISQAKNGEYVVVYCRLQSEMIDFAKQVLKMDEAAKPLGNPYVAKIKVGQGFITFENISNNFDWRTLRGRGVYPNVVTLVDHYTIEREYPAITEMLYKFIVPTDETTRY